MYIDFLDLHQNYENGYYLVYGVPRFCHVRTEDFKFITEVDVDITSRAEFHSLSLIDLYNVFLFFILK